MAVVPIFTHCRLVHVNDIPAAPQKKRAKEWQVWGKGGLLLLILLLPQFVLHIFLQIFSSKLWE